MCPSLQTRNVQCCSSSSSNFNSYCKVLRPLAFSFCCRHCHTLMVSSFSRLHKPVSHVRHARSSSPAPLAHTQLGPLSLTHSLTLPPFTFYLLLLLYTIVGTGWKICLSAVAGWTNLCGNGVVIKYYFTNIFKTSSQLIKNKLPSSSSSSTFQSLTDDWPKRANSPLLHTY